MNNPIALWHEVVTTRDAALLSALLHRDVVFQSPAMHTPQMGADKVSAYLLAALHVLGEAQFHYEREWHNTQSAVLKFSAHLDGVSIHGVDLIDWDAQGRITRFTVMVRPLKALHLLVERMGVQLARQHH